MTLEALGWNAVFEVEFAPFHQKGWKPARIVWHQKLIYGALLGDGTEVEVQLGGRSYRDAKTKAELPVVGDWVALELGDRPQGAIFRGRLARQSCLSRMAAGQSAEEQVLAANVTLVVVVTHAGPDFNPRRLERYVELIAHSRAKAVVLIHKADLFPEEQNQQAAQAVRALSADVDVHVTRLGKNPELECLKKYLKTGVSLAIVGSSGVGKSSLINQLLGEVSQETGGINDVTGKGRHTTTARELIVLPQGGILIDNPGIKEVQLWADPSTTTSRFADIAALAARCQYQDCQHGADAGCAIRRALGTGELPAERYRGYLEQAEEMEKIRRRDKQRQMDAARRSKRGHKAQPRNRSDRMDLEKDLRPRAVDGGD